jgi:hypothetical protein
MLILGDFLLLNFAVAAQRNQRTYILGNNNAAKHTIAFTTMSSKAELRPLTAFLLHKCKLTFTSVYYCQMVTVAIVNRPVCKERNYRVVCFSSHMLREQRCSSLKSVFMVLPYIII